MGSSVSLSTLGGSSCRVQLSPQDLGFTCADDGGTRPLQKTDPYHATDQRTAPWYTLQGLYSVTLKSRLKHNTSGRTPSWGAFGLSVGCQRPTTSSFYARGLMINTHLRSSQRSLGATEDQSLLSAFRAIPRGVLDLLARLNAIDFILQTFCLAHPIAGKPYSKVH